MKFREQLNKVNELGINICDLTIANECDCVFNFEYTEQEFEQLCNYVHYCYLKDESGQITPNHLALAINDLVLCKRRNIQDIIQIDKWEMLDMASYYI